MRVKVRFHYQHDLDLIGLVLNKSFNLNEVLKSIIYASARGIEIHPEFPKFIVPKRKIFKTYQIHIDIPERDQDVIDWVKGIRSRMRNSCIKNLLRSYIPKECGYNEIYREDIELPIASAGEKRTRGLKLDPFEKESRNSFHFLNEKIRPQDTHAETIVNSSNTNEVTKNIGLNALPEPVVQQISEILAGYFNIPATIPEDVKRDVGSSNKNDSESNENAVTADIENDHSTEDEDDSEDEYSGEFNMFSDFMK